MMLTLKKKGSSYVPESTYSLTFSCKIDTPIYDHNKKKYFNLELNDVTLVSQTHDQCKKYLDDKKIFNGPFVSSNVLKVKVPFNHGRVQCKMSGLKTISEYKKGDPLNVTIQFCGTWAIGNYCGVSWKIGSID